MKASLLQLANAILGFVLLFALCFVALPYVVTSVNYENSSSVSDLFPIAIQDEGKPAIVRWEEYNENPVAYAGKLIRAPMVAPFLLGQNESFTLESGSASSLALTLHEDDYTFWAHYAIEDGLAKPISFRFTGAFVVFYSFIFGLFGGLAFNFLWRKSETKAVKREA